MVRPVVVRTFLAESWNAKGPRRFLEAARLSSLRARHARTCQLTSRTWLNSAPCVVSRAPRTPLPLLNSTSTFYFPLPPSFDTFSHVPPRFPPFALYPAFPLFPSLRFPSLALASSPFLFPSLSLFTWLRFETDVGRKPRSVTRRRRRVTGSPIPYPTPLRDLLARRRNTSELAEYLLPIRYLRKMPRSRLGNASLPPFPYVRGGKGSSPLHHFSPYSYSTLAVPRALPSNEVLHSCNLSLSLSLSRFFLEPLVNSVSTTLVTRSLSLLPLTILKCGRI